MIKNHSSKKDNSENQYLLTQYLLQKEGEESFKVCWLNNNNLKPGMRVKLKDYGDCWFIIKEKYATMGADIISLNRNPEWFSIS